MFLSNRLDRAQSFGRGEQMCLEWFDCPTAPQDVTTSDHVRSTDRDSKSAAIMMLYGRLR
jgi:hypothetical protein